MPFDDATLRGDSAMQFHLLGIIDYDACLALQQRLVYEAGGRTDGQITVLVCEHPDVITVGRGGSRWDIRLSDHDLASRQVVIQWVGRGGGCLAHAPGQLAIYPIVPLNNARLTLGEYLRRLQSALRATLEELGLKPQVHPDRFGMWGRTGQLAAVGVAVKDWTTWHGAFINVAPAMYLQRGVRTTAGESITMTSLAAESQKPVRMTGVRSAIVRHIASAFGCDRYHIHSGHPLLSSYPKVVRESARAS